MMNIKNETGSTIKVNCVYKSESGVGETRGRGTYDYPSIENGNSVSIDTSWTSPSGFPFDSIKVFIGEKTFSIPKYIGYITIAGTDAYMGSETKPSDW